MYIEGKSTLSISKLGSVSTNKVLVMEFNTVKVLQNLNDLI